MSRLNNICNALALIREWKYLALFASWLIINDSTYEPRMARDLRILWPVEVLFLMICSFGIFQAGDLRGVSYGKRSAIMYLWGISARFEILLGVSVAESPLVFSARGLTSPKVLFQRADPGAGLTSTRSFERK